MSQRDWPRGSVILCCVNDSPFRRPLEGLLGIPATDGNSIEILRNGDEIFSSMLHDIRDAERSVDLLTYIYWSGDIGREFADTLSEKARQGLRVRTLLDAVGCLKMDDDLVEEMTDAGVMVRWFRPVKRTELGKVYNRTHRKVMVCDEVVGFTGGVGIADPWMGDARNETEWRDTHFRVTGPAVAGIRGAFVDNWAETDAPVYQEGVDTFPALTAAGESPVQVVQGDSGEGWTTVASLLRCLVRLAQERIRLTTAYFNPDDKFIDLLIDAAERGVEIEILLPGPHADKRFVQLASEGVYETLFDAGVKIWNYQTSMLHAKILTVDGVVANVGSANLNHRSALLDEEVCLVVHDPDVVATLDSHFDDDLVASLQIDPERWKERGAVQKGMEKAMRTVRDVM
ncbi:MAG: cardiolipin synthase B [Acidimicrobiia bacterium]|nr:cardiolipin synthase B [Acidimicrobiia bacterium]